ncbi:peroxidase family protein [Aureimonas glaciei]|nr:peroxidase family protein [Aureimonas glaciei]
MVSYIKSDLDFILDQIKISEAHAAGQPLYGPGGLIPAYNIAWGLRTVDGSYNHLLPGQEQWGAADNQFPELLQPVYRPADGTLFDPDGPGPAPAMPTAPNYNPSNNPNSLVFDSSLRTISNLLVDQTLGNPAAILTALERAGNANPIGTLPAVTAIYAAFKPALDAEYQARVLMQNAQTAVDDALLGADNNPSTPLSAAEQLILDAANAAFATATASHSAAVVTLEAARGVRDAALVPFAIEMDGDNVHLPNIAPDEGLSAPFNSWFTLFGQFFDHGLDLVNKGGSGTVFVPLQPDDPLYVEGSHTNFMVLTRATVSAGVDGVMGTADDVRPVNTTTAYVDQNQTYTSHPSHQVFLRQYELDANDVPHATGLLIEGANGGMATWGEVKAQARMLGIELTDNDVGSVPLLRTDQYGNFIPNAAGYAQIITGIGADGIPNTADDVVQSGTFAAPVNPTTVGALRTSHAFLADIAHDAVPLGKIADGDITVGLGNPGNGDTEYDNELLDAHFIAGDGRANENIGLTAVHHVFHAEHNRLVQHTKDVVLATGDAAFIAEWRKPDGSWDGERLFQAAKFGTEMQYQHLVFEEFARKIQPQINVFLVPDGFDTTLDPAIVAEFAHVVYRFGHSMLTESIEQFDPAFTPNHISLIEGFLNPTAFNGVGGSIDDGLAAGAIVRGMTRQVGNEIDEFVTGALRNNLLGLPLDLATINLARGRDTGVPSLNAARAEFYEASNQNVLLKPYESWVDFASHLKHEASIINFIAAYGTHDTILLASTLEEKRDAAMALVGLTATGSAAVAISNASFETDSLADLAPNVISDVLGNYTLTAPTGWTMSGTGGMFNPADGVTNNASIDGTNVVWLGQDGLLSQDTGVVLAEGATYSLSFDIGDRTDTAWPGGTARLFSSNGTVLATQVLTEPADGNWSTVTFDTGAIGAALAGQTLRIEIQQAGGSGNQILVDDIKLNVEQPLSPLDEDDRQAFLNGTGIYAGDKGGLDLVDLWIGGLAEEIMPFGGMLGSTFNFVFEVQMEQLQSGDRFYYLQRLDGLHLFGEMENNSFAAMIMRNTDATHLPSDVFSVPGLILEIDRTRQYNPGLGEDAGADGIMEDDPNTPNIDESADNRGLDPVGGGILTPLVVRNNPSTPGVDTNYLKYTGGDHVLLGGTEANDILIGGIGDDTLYGDGGGDRLDGGFGNDILNGGDGDDIIVDSGGDDNIKGGAGNDVIHAGPGLDLVLAGAGKDFVFLGTDMGSEVFAGEGDDFIYGNKNAERILGNEGSDWIETGTFDGAPGDNFDEVFAHDGIDGHDVFLGDGGFDEFIGEGGDDIMVGSAGRGKMAGMSGFDWATYKDNTSGVTADLSIPIVFDEAPVLPPNTALDEYASMEGLSGSRFNDVLKGSNALAEERLPYDPLAPAGTTGQEGYRGSQLTKEGIQLINGLAAVLGLTEAQVSAMVARQVVFSAGDIILGGDGSDSIQGNAGDDIIDGDKWLNVRISVRANADGTGPELESHNSMTTLAAKMFNGTFNPGQLVIVREILTDTTPGDIDTARYQGNRSEYAFSASTDGQLIVSHAIEDSLDGTDRLRNIERVEFLDGNPLNIIVGTPNNDTLNGTAQDDLILGLAGNDTLNGGTGNDILVGGPGADTLNGGLGDDTYSFALGDGNDAINEGFSATSGGTADRISILAPSTGLDVDGLPILTLNSLSMADNDTDSNDGELIITYGLPSGAQTVTQVITVNQQFDGANAQTGVERINFNGAVYAGYALGSEDYLISRDDGGANLSASLANNVIVGESTGDTITGGAGNDLIFGAGGDNNLIGGDGDDLLVGGSGTGDDDVLDGGLGADTMIGGGGNDDYVVDDLLDVVVEVAGAGTDEVRTEMAALSIELMANVENLTYAGVDADQFVGTGNAINNVISGGDLNDTLSGLGGNDTLQGGLGADTMIGGDGSDVYFVDEAGDVVTETNADLATGGADRVESDVDYTLGANVENLDLNNGALIGTGNALNNVINGNGNANQLFGRGGNDTIDGGDGSDLVDGGDGDDTLSGGAGGDVDTIIGGAGNDIIDVGSGNDVIAYNATGFGNDRVVNFDQNGGSAATQDLIDVSALDLTAANIGTTAAARIQIEDIEDGATDDTRITIRDAGGNVMGTILLEEIDNSTISASDFAFATTTTLGGATTGNNTLNGTNGNDTINALGGTDIVNGNGGNDTIIGGTGNDLLNGGVGDDTAIWNVGDGRDEFNGGTEGPLGDTFVINGDASAETYTIFTRAAWDAIPNNINASLDANTEIVITRNGTNFASVIAELWDVEEIRVNGSDPTGATGTAGGDTFNIIGDFSGTSLRPNTITIDGDAGDDTIDISSLNSAHRIVFKSNGGNDTIVGTLRPQDVIELPFGTAIADYAVTIDEETGQVLLEGEENSISFTMSSELPQFVTPALSDHDDDEGEDDHDSDDADDADDDGDDDDAPTPPPVAAGLVLTGTATADVMMGSAEADAFAGGDGDDVMLGGDEGDTLMGGSGADLVKGDAGSDMIFGGADGDVLLGGSGADMIFGEAGDDRLFGDDANDMLEGGAGSDTAYGGASDDRFIARQGDGDDIYWGEAGQDTLDYAAITASLTIDLGNGTMQHGSVASSQSGHDAIFGFENVIGGAGDDQIFASSVANVLDGGGGDDVFVFRTAADADGDLITGFASGDQIDLAGMTGPAGFSLETTSLTGAGQVLVSHVTGDDGEALTRIQGNVSGGPGADFTLDIAGTHNLTQSDFNGVA